MYTQAVYYLSRPLKERLKRKLSNYLAPDEEIVLATGVGRRFVQTKLLGSVLTIPLLIGIVSLARTVYLTQALTYLLTNRRVLVKKGLYSISLTSVPYDKITHIIVAQTFIERYGLNSGRIVIYTAGYDQREIVLDHVEAPIEFKNILEDLIAKERHQMIGPPQQPVEGFESRLDEPEVIRVIDLE